MLARMAYCHAILCASLVCTCFKLQCPACACAYVTAAARMRAKRATWYLQAHHVVKPVPLPAHSSVLHCSTYSFSRPINLPTQTLTRSSVAIANTMCKQP